MISRDINIHKNNHLLLVGPRGSGKSTLLRQLFGEQNVLWIDFLSDKDEDLYGRQPDQLSQVLAANQFDYVVIDEVQKFPKILDVVHREIEKPNNATIFILSGSSARKLKRGHANLLAGRLFLRELYPFHCFELAEKFQLEAALNWGLLPSILLLTSDEQKFLYLRSYCKTYIKEEVLVEQLIRKIDAFRDFLPVAAQANGKIINYSKIATQIGLNDNSVKNYFQILEDTLIGFFLPSFHRSIRKRQRQAPKFYFFDPGVKKALQGTLKVPLVPQTSEYGHAFEHFIILECIKLNEYKLRDYKFSYFLTKDNVEIDLIVERPNQPDLLLEIKSSDKVDERSVRTLAQIAESWDRNFEAQVWSRDKLSKKIHHVDCLHWKEGLRRLFQIGLDESHVG